MERLRGSVRDYAWGSTTALAELRGVEPSGGPEAEIWFGAHPSGGSTLRDRPGEPELAGEIARDPRTTLGPAVSARFGAELPFLVKLLAADAPLSIQVHPSVEQARTGFAREEAAGVARDAPNRNYRDRNHKPELLAALTEFEALVGFAEVEWAAVILDALGAPELEGVAASLGSDGPRAALRDILALSVADVARAVGAVAELGDRGRDGIDEHLDLLVRLAREHPDDRGVLCATLLNRIVLGPGDALYLGHGHLHAYVRGVGVEVMANSDNVVRCGLTRKHIDPVEVLDLVLDGAAPPHVLHPDDPVTTFATPTEEFALTRIRGTTSIVRSLRGPEIALCTEGRLTVGNPSGTCSVEAGGAVWIPASDRRISVEVDGEAFVTAVGEIGRAGDVRP